jgi:hypothetical protein
MQMRKQFALVLLALVLTACATTPAPTSSVSLSAASGEFKGIPQHVTADGHFALGNPEANVALIDYSDFL